MLFALELEKCTINKVPLNDCTPVTGRGCARLVSALLRVYSCRLVLTPTKRRKVSSYAPSPCVSLPLAMPSESLPRFHTLPRFHYHIKSSPLPDHYRCRHLLLAHPSHFSLLCRHSHAPRDPLQPPPHSLHLLSSFKRLVSLSPSFPATCPPSFPSPWLLSTSSLSSFPRSVPPLRSMSLFPPLSAVAQT